MYELIAANRRRSIALIVGAFVLFVAMGWVFDQAFGMGSIALVIAVLIAVALSWTSYWYSDRIALAMSRAKPADQVAHARLLNIVEGLAIAGGIPKPRVFVVEDDAPNAFATGRNPENAAIAVTTGLMAKMNRVELEGVIAHEMAHIRNHDILVTTIAVTLTGAIVLLSDFMRRALWWGGGGRRGRGRSESSGAGLPFALIGLALALLAPLVAGLVKAAVSRRRESLADVSAVHFTRYPPGLISALEKLRDDSTVIRTASRATAHLWIESPLDRGRKGFDGWINRLFDTHPPLQDRIDTLKSI